MEGNVVSSYLRSKFSSTLQGAGADAKISSEILARFASIEQHINRINQNSGAMVDLLYDLLDALSECTISADERSAEAASKKGYNFIRVVRFEKNMGSRLDKIEKNLLKNISLREYHNGSSGPSGLVIQQASHPDPSKIMGFELQVREIEELLVPPMEEDELQFKPIGIVGICGSGKTTLAQKVFASGVVEKEFFPRIWVSLSERLLDNERSDLRERVLNHILKESGHDASDLEYSDYSVAHLLEKLRLRLKGKRYLIVLEDAWRMDDWFANLAGGDQPPAESFTRGLPKGSGGAVIVTSRGERVIRRMVGEKHVFRPRLTDDFCWTIFREAVLQQGIDPHHHMLSIMEESVIHNCQGLPLAAMTLANVISELLVEK